MSPLSGAELVSPENNVVIRLGPAIDAASVDDVDLAVTGDRSGEHPGRMSLSDDGSTLVFVPTQPFDTNERVTVRLRGEIRTTSGASLPPLSFSFGVSSVDPRKQRRLPIERLLPGIPVDRFGRTLSSFPSGPNRIQAACDPPSGYPNVTVPTSHSPGSGVVFAAPFGGGPIGRLLILDNFGLPTFYRTFSTSGPTFDFKRQPNGLLTYFGANSTFWGLDSAYAVVDSFRTGNGYTADVHDLQVLPNNHALLLSYDVQPVRMDSIVPGGRPDAKVVGLIVQEIDQAKNVVFQWRSWDHFQITDADPCMQALTDSLVDYVHGNAVERDLDGNLLISCRSMHEITKISRSTGAIIWRWGLKAKNNQFTFIGDTRGFTGQHDIRRLPNGHVTLFDNGNCQSVIYSRALEYVLNETSKTATLVWEYRNNPDNNSPFMGNVQRESNGETMIGWGGTGPDPKLTELHSDGSESLEFGFSNSGQWTYRAFRFPWKTRLFVLSPESIEYGAVATGTTSDRTISILNRQSTPLTITCFAASDPAFSVLDATPITIAPGANRTVTVRFTATVPGQHTGSVHARHVDPDQIVSVPVNVHGIAGASLPGPSRSGLLALAGLLLAAGAWWARPRRARVPEPTT